MENVCSFIRRVRPHYRPGRPRHEANGVGPVCHILAERREEDRHPRGERSHLKDEERYALCGLGELITYEQG